MVSLLRRLETLIWGDKRINFGQVGEENLPSDVNAPAPESVAVAPLTVAPAIAGVPTAEVTTSQPAIIKDRVASIYWTGCDATFAYDAILRGGERATIAHVLRQANHHMKGTGMKGSPIQIRLQRLTDEAATSLEKDWTPQRRVDDAREVYAIAREFGEMTQKLQTVFSGDPTTSD